MRIYAVIVIFGLTLFLTGCPDKPDKSDQAMPMEDTSKSSVTTEMELPELKEGMENMDGEKKMEGATDQPDTQ